MNADDIVNFITQNYGWAYGVMSVALSIVAELVKVPIKKLTSKIAKENLRKLANKSIILVAFGLAFLLDYACSLIFPCYFTFSSIRSIAVGCFSNVLYALAEGVITPVQAKTAVEGTKTAIDKLADGKTTDAIEAAKQAYDEVVEKNVKK